MRTMKGNELEPTCFAKFSLQAMTNFSMTSSSLTFSNFGGNCSNVSEIILVCEHLEKILTISCEHLVELVVFALSYTCKMVKQFLLAREEHYTILLPTAAQKIPRQQPRIWRKVQKNGGSPATPLPTFGRYARDNFSTCISWGNGVEMDQIRVLVQKLG